MKSFNNLSQQRILVGGVHALGDAVMSLPAVSAIVAWAENRDVEVDLVSSSLSASIYARAGVAISVRPLPSTGSFDIMRAFWRLRDKYDATLLLSGGFVWAFGAFLARIPLRAGLASDGRSWLLQRRAVLDVESMHGVEAYLRVAQLLTDVESSVTAPKVVLQESDTQSAFLLKKRYGVTTSYFTVAPSASSVYKSWPAERFAALSTRIIAETGQNCILLGSKSDKGLCEQVEQLVNSPKVVNFVGEAALPTVAAIMKDACFHIGNNSGLSHLAAAVGSKVVTISGASNLRKTAPYGEGHILCGGLTPQYTARQKGRGVDPLLLQIEVSQVAQQLAARNYFLD